MYIGKFSVQETGEGGDQDLPSWHTTAPPIKSSYKDEHAYELKGMYVMDIGTSGEWPVRFPNCEDLIKRPITP